MWIMALHAVGRRKGLVVMCFLQSRIFCIVAIQAQRWSSFREMESVFRGWFSACFVHCVTGVASHVERGVAGALFGSIHALGMA